MNVNGKIDVGDIVDIHFTSSQSIFNAQVLGLPSDVGDSWKLVLEGGGLANVVLYEQMIKKGAADE